MFELRPSGQAFAWEKGQTSLAFICVSNDVKRSFRMAIRNQSLRSNLARSINWMEDRGQSKLAKPSRSPMADKDVLLLSSWASVFGLRVQIALAEKGVDYELTEEDLFDKSPLLLQSNPVHKKIPVLVHNGKPVCESSIIIQYIDEVWTNGPSLLPKDPLQRPNARFWVNFIDKTIYECGSRIWRKKGDVQAAAKKELIGILKQLEGELGEKPFFGGETLGYVDIALVPFSRWFYTYETFGGFSIEKECPKLMPWVRRCNERESVSKVLPHPHKVYERNCGLKKRLGLEYNFLDKFGGYI